jgi:FXSXX-COOH protein
VDSAARHIGTGPDECMIPDLRDIPFAQLATPGERAVKEVVSRIVADAERSSDVPAMMFNSAI